MIDPQATLYLSLEQLRVLSKSVSKTRDAEMRKLARLKTGSHVYNEVLSDFKEIDGVDVAIGNAISQLVASL